MSKLNVDELKNLAEHKKVIFGTSSVIRKLKQGMLKKVYVASNIPQEVEDDISHNARIANAEMEKVDVANDEFGIIFRRAHVLLTIGVLKD